MRRRLDPEQIELLRQMADVARSVERSERVFLVVRTFGGDFVDGAGARFDVEQDDVQQLVRYGYLREIEHGRDSMQLVVTVEGFELFEDIAAGESKDKPLTAEVGEMLSSSAAARTAVASAGGVRSAIPPTAVVLWAHGDPEWGPDDEELWRNTVLAFTHLLRGWGIDVDLDLFHGHTATDWARFGPKAIRASDYVLVAVSPTWRRAWDDDIEPDKYSGAVGEANVLRGLFKESRQRFLERVIPVLLPGRGESDLPTELKATIHWERVPRLDEQGIEKLYRRITCQAGDPKPPLGELRTLPPRQPTTAGPTPLEEAHGPDIKAPSDSQEEAHTESQTEIRHQIDRAESALAEMPPPSPGSGEEPWDQARASVKRRQALLARLAQHESGNEQRSVLEGAARLLRAARLAVRLGPSGTRVGVLIASRLALDLWAAMATWDPG